MLKRLFRGFIVLFKAELMMWAILLTLSAIIGVIYAVVH
jgi:hypothetical protein